MPATVKNFKGLPIPVKIGDCVGFKSDIEQYGRIAKIERNRSMCGEGYDLTLYAGDGQKFRGEYIGGMRTTVVHTDDCWID
jgi:hypothetical protein